MKVKWSDNEAVAYWLEANTVEPVSSTFIADKLKTLRHGQVLGQLKNIINDYPEVALESIHQLVESTSSEKIKELIDTLTEKLNAALSSASAAQTPASSQEATMTPIMRNSNKDTSQQNNTNLKTSMLPNNTSTPNPSTTSPNPSASSNKN